MTRRATLGSSRTPHATPAIGAESASPADRLPASKTLEGVIPSSVEYTRLEFLRTAGSVALFAAMGITVSACGVTNTNDDSEEGGGSGGGGGTDTGVTVTGSIVTIDLTKSGGQPLAPSGGWLLNTQAGILAVNINGSVIRAFTNVCTHSGCPNSWEFGNSLFTCTCHNSKFNTAGEVVQGPATRDLDEYTVSRNGNIVTIDKATPA